MQSPFTKLRTFATGIAALALTPAISFADSIDPLTYSATLGLGESVTITKTVTITEAPPTDAVLDVMFLMDTTGSMGGAISGAKSAATTILTDLAAFGDLASGTAYFNDDSCFGSCSGTVAPLSTYTAITSALSTNDANTIAGINGFAAGVPGGGSDSPEEGFLGISNTANNTAWRAGSNRFMVMFGDNTDGYFKSDVGDTMFAGDTEAEAIANLAANNITLIGVAINSSGSFTGAYDLTAEASGGDVFNSSTSGTALAQTIKDAVTASFATYSSVCLDVSNAPAGVGVTSAPVCHNGSYDRSVERTFEFDVTFTGLAVGEHDEFPIHALVDGGIVATELDSITVEANVPEPGALGLLGLGLMLMGMRRRKLQAA